jgi:hypothetical protein
MEKLLGGALELLKLAPRYLAAIAAAAGFLLFGSDELLKRLGVANFAQHQREWIGLCLLVASALLLMDGGVAVVRGVRDFMRHREFVKRRTQRLHALTEEEKQILRYYVAAQTKTNVLRLDDGVVQGLVSAGVIHRAATMGNFLEGLAHNIDDSVWQYLNEHHTILNGTTTTARTDSRRDFDNIGY